MGEIIFWLATLVGGSVWLIRRRHAQVVEDRAARRFHRMLMANDARPSGTVRVIRGPRAFDWTTDAPEPTEWRRTG